jgi:multicomponent Na+:H+ antiporter subunit E
MSGILKSRGARLRAISLVAFLFVFWLALSGHYSPVLIGAGLASAILCMLAARRLGMLDADGHPAHLLVRIWSYYPWLFAEMVKSAWRVTKIVLHPKLPISPTMTTLKASQVTAVGIATYANSITLTPGTLTVDVREGELIIHALIRADAIDLETGEMDRRVTRFEGGE